MSDMLGKEQRTESAKSGGAHDNAFEVAVLMAAYNGERFISEQIESILQQEYVSISLFISLDFSSDSTLEILKRYSEKNDNITLLPYGARYGSAAQNFFRLIKDVDLEKYKYVSLSDQDDIWDSKKINEAIRVLERNGHSAYSSNVLAFWEDGRTKLLEKSQPLRKWDYLFESAGPGCSYVFERSLALDLKKLLLSKSTETSKVALHDWLIYAFARAKGYKWTIDPRTFVLYRQHGANVIGANNGFKSALYRYKLLRTGWYKSQTALFIDLLGVNYFENRLNDHFFLLRNVRHFRRKSIDRILLALFFLLRIF